MAPITKVYDGWGCLYNAIFIPQISNLSITSNIDEEVHAGAGEVDSTFVAEREEKPQISFTTSAIAIALGAAGIGGSEIAAASLFTTYLQALEDGAIRDAAAVHQKAVINKGMLYPTRISAQHNQPATLEMLAEAVFNGTLAPIVMTDSNALSGTNITSELFTVGEVDINNATIEGIQSIDIDFGITTLVLGSDGNFRPTFVAIQNRRPSITFTTNDASRLAALGLSGIAQGGTDSIFYLRAFNKGSTRWADANVPKKHISFTVADGMIRISENAVGLDPSVTTFIITPASNNSDAIIVIDVATDIV